MVGIDAISLKLITTGYADLRRGPIDRESVRNKQIGADEGNRTLVRNLGIASLPDYAAAPRHVSRSRARL